MKMKKSYDEPEIELIKINACDIVTGSEPGAVQIDNLAGQEDEYELFEIGDYEI